MCASYSMALRDQNRLVYEDDRDRVARVPEALPVIASLTATIAKGGYAVALANTATSATMKEFPAALLIQATRGG